MEKICVNCEHWDITGWGRNRAEANRGNCTMMITPAFACHTQTRRGGPVEIFSGCGTLPHYTQAMTKPSFGCNEFKPCAESRRP